ncbi:MAG: SCO family protein [Hyphomicrobiaceae bacterium]
MSPRAILATAAGAALAIAAMIGLTLALTGAFTPGTGYRALVGGPFAMSTATGGRLTDRDLRGKPFAIFFGFTQCPDVCPTTMLEVANMMEKLGPDAERMRYLFVTVDPERDTAELLRDYLASFDRRIVGLLGTPDETAAIAKAYRIYYAKVPTKESYTLNHTATMYLMDAEGRLAKTVSFGEDEGSRLKKVRDLIAASPVR